MSMPRAADYAKGFIQNWQRWLPLDAMTWGWGLWLVSPTLWASETLTGLVISIPDGDTLWVQPDNDRSPRKLRLLGVDAPEICQAGGIASRDALIRLIGHRRVSVTAKYVDVYGRDLVRIQMNGQDVAAQMVRSGHAWSNRWHKSLGPYAAEEAFARQAKVGLFAQPTPELPRDFRKRFGTCYLETPR